jgi:hypothetical protein
MKLSLNRSDLRLCVEVAFVDYLIASNLNLIFKTENIQSNNVNRYRDKSYQYCIEDSQLLRVYFNDDHTWLCEKSPSQFSKTGSCFVELYCLLYKMEPKDVINQVKLQIQGKKVHQRSNIVKGLPTYLDLGLHLRRSLIPPSIKYGSCIYNKLIEYDYFVNDRRFGLVVKYASSDHYFEVPLEPYYSFDSNSLNDAYYFLNFDCFYDSFPDNSILYSNSDPKIIVFADYSLSVKFNKIIIGSCRFDYSDFVATSFLYVNHKLIDDFCDYFQNHEVIYIPNGERDSFINFGLFQKLSDKIPKFKIFKDIVFLHDGTSVDNSNLIENNKFDKYLNDSYLLVDSCKSDVLIDIATKSLDYKNYLLWCTLFGLNNSQEKHDERSSLFIDLKMDHLVNCQSTPSLSSIFSHGSISFFYGKPKTGKSLFVTSLFYYLAMNFCPFDFDVQSSRRVLLIDFKSNKNDFLIKLNSIHGPYFQNMPPSNNFFVSLVKEVCPDFIYDFADADFQSYVETAILNSKCDIILFDSIYIKSSAWKKFTSNWKNINDWLQKIQNKYSVAIVFIFDHVSDLNYYQDIYYDAHNVVHISAPLSKSGDEKCVQIQCKFESVRSTPGLYGKMFCYSKPYFDDINMSKWNIVDIDLDANSKSNNLEAKFSNYEKVLIFIQNNPNFTREDIDKLLCRSPSLSQKIIQRIVKDGKVRKINTTKKASYQFTG